MDKNKTSWLERWKYGLYTERQAVDSLAATVKANTASVLAIAAALAIPAVPAIFASSGVYAQTETWHPYLRWAAAIAIGVGVEGAGVFLSILATKTYAAWRKKAATVSEVLAIATSVILYTAIVVSLIAMSDLDWGLKVVICLIPFLGVTFYLGLGFETELTDRLDEAAAAKRQAKADRNERRKEKEAGGNSGGNSTGNSTRSTPSVMEIMKTHGVKKSRAYEILKEMKNGNN